MSNYYVFIEDILYYICLILCYCHLIGSTGISNLLDTGETPPNNAMNEKMAINAIQNALMSYESTVNSTSSTITMPGTPPAYSTAVSFCSVLIILFNLSLQIYWNLYYYILRCGTTLLISKQKPFQLGTVAVTTSHNYQPPPMYQQQSRIKFGNTQPGVRQGTQFTQQLQMQRSKLIQHQQQQQQQQQLKQRLLQQQQQQHMLIPSNATATDQITAGIHNIDNLINNTVAPPNVSLQVC